MTLRDRAGEVQRFDFPRAAVVEVRPNRFDAGLWLDITGHVKETFLAEMPRETIELLASELQATLANEPSQRACSP